MSVIHSFPNHLYNGKIYNLSHLGPQKHVLTGHGRNNADIRIRSSFHSHVFSSACVNKEDSFVKDESGRIRKFCPERYEKSIILPNMCFNMISENHITWESKDKNRVSNLAVNGNILKTGEHYVAIYYLFPSRSDKFDVELIVKSAYNMSVDFSKIKRKYKMVSQIKTCYYKNKKIP